MTAHFTDRDERLWQRHAEERAARPLPAGTWLRALRAALRPHRPAARDAVEGPGPQIVVARTTC
ncbi:hypothetical protein ACFFSH_19955 [Streptomyces filamentosus]|uniref:Uncharacterized protein n=1 Tax=Streptomyces filamentosus TaxID=67294 RepID=A0A919BSY1_STRFL|nr:hypothetical protein [Streptomyces filamentosus]KAA6216088.1 hypothetical protein CP979_03370 [Streptomyces filamentosus]GHG09605.1 hypothetical protein GCM10017667_47510 [Streptomyces filamentosus]